MEARLKAQITAVIPNLRAFGILLCGDTEFADNCVEEAISSFVKKPPLRTDVGPEVHLFTRLRDVFQTRTRKGHRWRLEASMQNLRFRQALSRLTYDEREALLLTEAQGLSETEVSRVTGCKKDTVLPRVERAQARLAAMLSLA